MSQNSHATQDKIDKLPKQRVTSNIRQNQLSEGEDTQSLPNDFSVLKAFLDSENERKEQGKNQGNEDSSNQFQSTKLQQSSNRNSQKLESRMIWLIGGILGGGWLSILLALSLFSYYTGSTIVTSLSGIIILTTSAVFPLLLLSLFCVLTNKVLFRLNYYQANDGNNWTTVEKMPNFVEWESAARYSLDEVNRKAAEVTLEIQQLTKQFEENLPGLQQKLTAFTQQIDDETSIAISQSVNALEEVEQATKRVAKQSEERKNALIEISNQLAEIESVAELKGKKRLGQLSNIVGECDTELKKMQKFLDSNLEYFENSSRKIETIANQNKVHQDQLLRDFETKSARFTEKNAETSKLNSKIIEQQDKISAQLEQHASMIAEESRAAENKRTKWFESQQKQLHKIMNSGKSEFAELAGQIEKDLEKIRQAIAATREAMAQSSEESTLSAEKIKLYFDDLMDEIVASREETESLLGAAAKE